MDGHHVRHWADGGETRLSNLVLLCRFHHRLVHEGGFAVEVGNESRLKPLLQRFDPATVFVFKRPDGTRVEDTGRTGPLTDSSAGDFIVGNTMRGILIDPDTGIPDWGGETMDDSLAIEGLMRRDGLWGNVAAETRLA